MSRPVWQQQAQRRQQAQQQQQQLYHQGGIHHTIQQQRARQSHRGQVAQQSGCLVALLVSVMRLGALVLVAFLVLMLVVAYG